MDIRRIEICEILCECLRFPTSAWSIIYKNLLQPLRKELSGVPPYLVVEAHKKRDLYVYACKRSYQFYASLLKDEMLDPSEAELRLGDLARYMAWADSRHYRLDVAKRHYQSSGFGQNGASFMQLYIIYNSTGEKELAFLAVLRGCALGNARAHVELNRAARNAGWLGNITPSLKSQDPIPLPPPNVCSKYQGKLLACAAAIICRLFPEFTMDCERILTAYPLELLDSDDIDLKHLICNL